MMFSGIFHRGVQRFSGLCHLVELLYVVRHFIIGHCLPVIFQQDLNTHLESL